MTKCLSSNPHACTRLHKRLLTAELLQQGGKYYVEGCLGIVGTSVVHLKIMPGTENAAYESLSKMEATAVKSQSNHHGQYADLCLDLQPSCGSQPCQLQSRSSRCSCLESWQYAQPPHSGKTAMNARLGHTCTCFQESLHEKCLLNIVAQYMLED